LVSQKQGPFLATGVVCRKSPARIDTSPGFKASWIHIPTPYQTPPTCTITTAGGSLLLCGAVAIVLCLYMMSQVRNQLQVCSRTASHHIHSLLEGRNVRNREHSPNLHILFLLRCITILHAHLSLGLSSICCDLIVNFQLPPSDTSMFSIFSFCSAVDVFRTAYR
jgi:hypothetical protein